LHAEFGGELLGSLIQNFINTELRFWFLTLSFYAILRSIPNKLGGVLAMFSAIIVWVLLPIINTSTIRSNLFRPISSVLFWVLAGNFLILGWIGQQPVEFPFMEIGMFSTALYFFIFLLLFPLFGIIEGLDI
jgi:ubiquinol-cytochrome c reductase cytochrome b subunit